MLFDMRFMQLEPPRNKIYYIRRHIIRHILRLFMLITLVTRSILFTKPILRIRDLRARPSQTSTQNDASLLIEHMMTKVIQLHLIRARRKIRARDSLKILQTGAQGGDDLICLDALSDDFA